MKKRNIVLAIVFSIITFGIYGIYWFVKLTNDSNKLAPNHATMGGVAAFFVTLITGGIYGLYWSFRLGQKADDMGAGSSSGIIYLIVSLFGFGIVAWCLAQSAINKKLDEQPTATTAA